MPNSVDLPVLRVPYCESSELGSPEFAWDSIPFTWLSENVSGNAPQQPTAVQSVWTDQEWVVRFTVWDDEVRASIRERDGHLWEEEVVEIFFDPVGDLDAYFELELNPLGTVCDLVLRRNRSGYVKDFEWNCGGLITDAKSTRDGWIGEFRIPFQSVSDGSPRPGTRWRGNFLRIDRPSNQPWELSAWSPTGIPLFHVQKRFGWIEFVC